MANLFKLCAQKCIKWFSSVKLKYVCAVITIFFVLDFSGLLKHIFERSYHDAFVYPYNGDIHEFIIALRQNRRPDAPPINVYNYSFVHEIKNKCFEPSFHTLRIVLLVKSSVENFHRRMAIRNSWGYEKRFSDVPVRTIFLLGVHFNDDELKTKVNLESSTYQDIMQAEFYDSYYNNTIKTMMGFKWALDHCSNSKFYMFVDDDMYVSVKNVLKFIRNPALYPDLLKDGVKFSKDKL